MGDDTREVSDPRGRGRDTTPYTQSEIDALGIRIEALQACDQIGMALSRWDASKGVLHLSRLAQFFLGREAEAFTKSGLFATILSTSNADAQWDYTLESGRVLRLRRAGGDEASLVTFHDVTLEADSREVIARSGQLKVGYLQSNIASGRHLVFGECLDKLLTRREQLDLRRSGFRTIIHPRSRERFDSDMSALQSRGLSVDRIFEFTCQRRESFHLHLQLFAMTSSSGKIVKIAGAFRDVSSERQAQAELVRLRNEHASDAEARQFVVSRVAHEIRTPLSGVVGLAQFMSQAAGVPQGLLQQLQVLQRAAQDALRHIDTLTDPAGIRSEASTSSESVVDLRSLIRDVAALWSVRARQNGSTLNVRIAGDVPSDMVVDSVKLRHCLNTLLAGAVERTASGTISVGCGLSKSEGTSQLIIGVRDSGVAPDPSHASSEAKQRAVLQRTVADMGGKLESRATQGGGTTSTMLLPTSVEEIEPDSSDELVSTLMSRQPAAEVSPYKDLRVLAVDDNAINGQVIEQLLHGRVAKVVLAANGKQALEKLEAEPFDLILMDIHMPIMDGIECTLAIRGSRKTYSDIPIVALTADADYQQKRVAVNLGMDAALAKPVTLSKLLQVFESLGLSDSRRRAA